MLPLFVSHGCQGGELLNELKAIQQFMIGTGAVFDEDHYIELSNCLVELDDVLLDSTDAQWKAFKDYASTQGSPGVDHWKTCDERVSYQSLYPALTY